MSDELRAIIQRRDLTAYSLGQAAGVDPGVVQRFLSRQRDIRLQTLDRLAAALGLRLVEDGRSKNRPVLEPAAEVEASA